MKPEPITPFGRNMMKQILIYSDSLTWGIIPGTRNRLPFEKRWTGVLEHSLALSQQKVRVIEDCLNGRRTVWDDPFKAGRNGLVGLAQRIEVSSPLALVVLMLGTNDFQRAHQNDAWSSAQGVGALVDVVRQAPIEPGMAQPKILVVCPPLIQEPKGDIAAKFLGGDLKCVGMGAAFAEVSKQKGCAFFDAQSVASSSAVDGIHLDEPQHHTLGAALAPVVLGLIGPS